MTSHSIHQIKTNLHSSFLCTQSLVPPDPMSQFNLRRFSPDDEFPDLCRNSTWMGRILTPAMYRRQFDRCTDSGVIFDDIIRPGLEEPGDVIPMFSLVLYVCPSCRYGPVFVTLCV